VADKSGGAGGIRNDVAIVVPPSGGPVVISVLTTRNDPAARYDDSLVAAVAEVALSAVAAARPLVEWAEDAPPAVTSSIFCPLVADHQRGDDLGRPPRHHLFAPRSRGLPRDVVAPP
ncbi:hypothetical protein IFT79_15970, partial [Frigoribacterium sp. CFBP 8759]|nr:hypothetical protein [Frigoribacterium sp. CFBP 8759]